MSVSSLLSIGAFSSATQLSAKALRLYAGHGILAPARIDAETGYRYYRPEQVRDAHLVRLLRDLDMPLAEIAAMIASPSAIESALKRQMDALAGRRERQQAAYQATLTLLHSTAMPTARPILQRRLPAMTTVTLRFEASVCNLLARARRLLAGLRTTMDDHTIDPGNAFIPLAVPLHGQDDISVELCVPMLASTPLDEISGYRAWPALTMACIDVATQEDIPDLVAASDALFDWFDRHWHGLRDTPRLQLHTGESELMWPIS